MDNRIGFTLPHQKVDEANGLQADVELLKKRVEALENGQGNYQQYLALKEKFEKS